MASSTSHGRLVAASQGRSLVNFSAHRKHLLWAAHLHFSLS